MAKKVRMTDELLVRARTIFRPGQVLYSGEGLERKELRFLVRRGLVMKRMSGSISPQRLVYVAKSDLWR